VRRKRFSVGTLVGTFSVDGSDREIDNAYGLELGMALPIPLGGAMKDRLGLGVGVYIPTQVLNRARAPQPTVPFFVLLENRSQVVGLQIALGVRTTERWSFGAGVLVLAALRGRSTSSPTCRGASPPSRSSNSCRRSRRCSARATAPPTRSRWRGRSDWHRSPPTTSPSIPTSARRWPVTLPVIHVTGVAQYDPMVLALEGAWRRGRLLLVGQLAWQHWSAFPNPTDNPVAAMPARDGPEFHDTVVPRLGAEWTLPISDWALAPRGGAFFAATPAPDGPLLDNHRLGVSAGVGFLVDPIRVDVWFQTHLLLGRRQSEIDTSGAIFAGGLVVGVDL